jgi:hypothetical protein
MRFMVMVKATKDSEAGAPPTRELLEAMMAYNEELVKAGIMMGGEGLQPSSKGARVQFDGAKRAVVDGPFAETKELVAGFWILQVKSLEEAIEWLKRAPFQDGQVEIRPVAEAAEVGFVGEIENVDVNVLNHIASDFIPVIAGAGSDREGNSYNVNADSAAGKVAAALPAYKAIFLTDIEGWREDADDPASLVSQATVAEVQASLASVDGGMRPKLAACVEAIAGGAQSAHILDGRRPHSLLLELFTDAGIGTKVTP